jgi:PadR family transcriptional regulator, regulatory protein PadR
MAFRSDIYALILATLQEGPRHGYQIVKRIRDTGGAGRLSEGQIYPYLHKLEQEGMVTAEWQTDTGAAPRRVYELTIQGTKELERQKGLWQKFTAGVGSLLASEPIKEAGNA